MCKKYLGMQMWPYEWGFRHGPFDIQGGRGAWVFGPGQDIFSDKIRARLFFSPAVRAGLFFIHNKKLHL